MSEPSADRRLEPFTRNQVIALLGIYAGQVGSYTTLLWQVPALSLTAQSFLLTIALSSGNGTAARVTAAALSVVISASSYALMHDQRGHAINHGELAMRLSGRLELSRLIATSLQVEDGVPKATDANTVWTWHHDSCRWRNRLPGRARGSAGPPEPNGRLRHAMTTCRSDRLT